MLAEELGEVVRRHLAGAHVGRHEIQEGLRMAAIPVIGARRRVLLGPVEKRFEDDDDWFVADLVDAAAHEHVVLGECLVAVSAEIDLLAVELDIPAVTGLAEEGFGEMGH